LRDHQVIQHCYDPPHTATPVRKSPFPLLAQSGHAERTQSMSLSGVKRTWPIALDMSAFDPKRTWRGQLSVRFQFPEQHLADNRSDKKSSLSKAAFRSRLVSRLATLGRGRDRRAP